MKHDRLYYALKSLNAASERVLELIQNEEFDYERDMLDFLIVLDNSAETIESVELNYSSPDSNVVEA